MFFVSAVRNIILQKSRETFPFQEYEERPQPLPHNRPAQAALRLACLNTPS
jgi:hypothetical protein